MSDRERGAQPLEADIPREGEMAHGDRELPPLNPPKRATKLFNGFVIVTIASLGAALIYHMNNGPTRKERRAKAAHARIAKVNAVRGNLPPLGAIPRPKSTAPKAVSKPPAPVAPPSLVPQRPPVVLHATATGETRKSAAEVIHERRLHDGLEPGSAVGGQSAGGSDSSVSDSGGVTRAVATVGTGGKSEAAVRPMAFNNDDVRGGRGLAGQLTPTVAPAVVAGVTIDRNYLLPKGAFLDCVLETRIVSTVAGMVTCELDRNVYSDNGKVLLLERGSRLVGEYRNGIRHGEDRIFVLWDRVETPHGIVANLNSPGTDSLGGGGINGWVDGHFWQRFGGAILLSVIDSSLAAAANSTNNANTQVLVNSSSQAAQDMASEALKNTINIPPTLYVNQGTHINIFVTRDVDFRRVYALRAR